MPKLNYFPASLVLRTDGNARPVTGRQYLGRGDDEGPALLITRRVDKTSLRLLWERYKPILAIFDAHCMIASTNSLGTPTLVYHESIFSPELAQTADEELVCYCLPDNRFEHFCSQTRLNIIEPEESPELMATWNDIDGAIQALTELVDQRRDRVVMEVYRAAIRLRGILLSLPVAIQLYESMLQMTNQTENSHYMFSVRQSIQFLENRSAEMTAIGEWEELILQELVTGFRQLEGLLQQRSPKMEPVITAINNSLRQSRRAVLIVNDQKYAEVLELIAGSPEPYGWGFPPDAVTAATIKSVPFLSAEQDCIIHQAFDPHGIFTALAGLTSRQVTFIMLSNELRFLGERFLRVRKLFPNHPANENILRPIHDQVGRLSSVLRPQPQRLERTDALLSDSEFDMFMRVFHQGAINTGYGTVLLDEASDADRDMNDEVVARLVRLEGDGVVLLNIANRIAYLHDDTVAHGSVDSLVPGDQLIVINPEARDSIAHRIFAARSDEKVVQGEKALIKKWQEELRDGIRRIGHTYQQILDSIQALGSQRESPAVIGLWIRGDVLGPQDIKDLHRIGEVIDSAWLMENWQRVWEALTVVRSGHRLLGRRITQIIQQAAVGNYRLSPKDEQFLRQIGITMGALHDAAILLMVESVSGETRTVAVRQTGKIVFDNVEEYTNVSNRSAGADPEHPR